MRACTEKKTFFFICNECCIENIYMSINQNSLSAFIVVMSMNRTGSGTGGVKLLSSDRRWAHVNWLWCGRFSINGFDSVGWSVRCFDWECWFFPNDFVRWGRTKLRRIRAISSLSIFTTSTEHSLHPKTSFKNSSARCERNSENHNYHLYLFTNQIRYKWKKRKFYVNLFSQMCQMLIQNDTKYQLGIWNIKSKWDLIVSLFPFIHDLTKAVKTDLEQNSIKYSLLFMMIFSKFQLFKIDAQIWIKWAVCTFCIRSKRIVTLTVFFTKRLKLMHKYDDSNCCVSVWVVKQ